MAALPEDSAAALGWPARAPDLAALLPGPDGVVGPVRLTLPDPGRSAATVGLLLGLQAVVGSDAGRAQLTGALRAAALTDERADRLLLSVTAGSGAAVPATEQLVAARNAERPATPLVAVYPAAGSSFFDNPSVTLAADHVQQDRAQRLLALLTGDIGRRLLLDAGFRDATGAAGPPLRAEARVDPRRPGSGPAPDAGRVDAAVRALTTSRLGSRILAVIDVSG